MAADPKDYLWNNIVSLLGLEETAGVDAVFACLKKSKSASRGTVQRIRQKQTSVGTDKIKAIADHFGLEIWQLLLPDGAATQPGQWPFQTIGPERFAKLPERYQGMAEQEVRRIIEEWELKGGGLGGSGPSPGHDPKVVNG